ncbi:hypothetical protein RB653_005695 [Dictyostelium firmibasis]|uniref:IPT/TIG domain-containing protein n=1 Tax=Dictyostelium firmibasis TaxID=79012 RepID=A0AAN7ULH3_9MYCE
MICKKTLFITLIFSFFMKTLSIDDPLYIRAAPYAIQYNETSIVLLFDIKAAYYTRIILYQNKTTPKFDSKPNHFDCVLVDTTRYCTFITEESPTRFWSSGWSKVCAREVSNSTEDCESNFLLEHRLPAPYNSKFNRLPPTSGGDVIVTGSYLRFAGGPNIIVNSYLGKPFLVVKGNFSDPTFDVNNITIVFTPGSGRNFLCFDDGCQNLYYYTYAPPSISDIKPDKSKSVLTINGDNFFNDTSLLKVYFDGIQQTSLNITVDHKQIQVNNFSRVDPGPMSINITVDKISIEKNFIYCFPATVTSVTSVSNLIGGIVTIKGSKLSTTTNSTLNPIVTIGDQQCKFIKSTTTELECQLDVNNVGGKNLSVNVIFDGCSSISTGVTFTYNIPKLSSASYSNGIVTLNGINLGSNNVSIIQLYDNGINVNKPVKQIQVSSDEKSLTFTLPPLKCNLFNINFTRDNISVNLLSISASLSINVANRPSVVNGSLSLDLYYINCSVTQSTPSIIVGSLPENQCSIPSSTSTSEFYQTTCNTPYGTGTNKQFTFKYISYSFNNTFSYALPIITSRTFSKDLTNITIHGSNFGNSTTLIQVQFNGSYITSEIQSLNNNQFTFKILESYENGEINITLDGVSMESKFNLTFPPVIYAIINKDNKTLSCGGIITVSGKNLLTNDEEFKVKVLANNETTTVIISDENKLIFRAGSKKSPLIVSVLIGSNLILSNVTLTYLTPIITDYPSTIKNNKDGISLLIRGISFPEIQNINANITLSSSNVPLTCNLQCSVLQNETFYYFISNTSKSISNENNNSNSTDCLLCYSKSNSKEITGVLNLQLGSTLFQHDVNFEEIESSLPSNDNDGNKSSKLSGGAIAGITIGSVAAAGSLVGCVIYFKLITRVFLFKTSTINNKNNERFSNLFIKNLTISNKVIANSSIESSSIYNSSLDEFSSILKEDLIELIVIHILKIKDDEEREDFVNRLLEEIELKKKEQIFNSTIHL